MQCQKTNRAPSVARWGRPLRKRPRGPQTQSSDCRRWPLSGLWIIPVPVGGDETIVRASGSGRHALGLSTSPARTRRRRLDALQRPRRLHGARVWWTIPSDVEVEILVAGSDVQLRAARPSRRPRPRHRQAGQDRALAAAGARRRGRPSGAQIESRDRRLILDGVPGSDRTARSRARSGAASCTLFGCSLTADEVLAIGSFHRRDAQWMARQALTLERVRPVHGRLLVAFGATRTAAAPLSWRGRAAGRRRVVCPIRDRTPPTSFQLIGLEVRHRRRPAARHGGGGDATGAHPIYVVRGEREILVPATTEVVRRVDLEHGVDHRGRCPRGSRSSVPR